MSENELRADAVLFDKDGTLFDFSATWEGWAESFLLRLCNNDWDRAREVGDAIGFDLATRKFHPDSCVISGTPNEIVEDLQKVMPDIGPQFMLQVVNEEAAKAPQAEVIPLKPFLEELREMGLLLGVATNDAEMPTFEHLKSVGIDEAFDFVAGSDSGFGGKPEPGQMLAFLEHVGVSPDRAVMVGDSTHDLKAGRAAGMQTVAVLTGLADQAVLDPWADAVLSNIGHLPTWLQMS